MALPEGCVGGRTVLCSNQEGIVGYVGEKVQDN